MACYNSDKENAEALCDAWHHQWKETYYGLTCENCGLFIPDGCGPWLPQDDAEDDDAFFDDLDNYYLWWEQSE